MPDVGGIAGDRLKSFIERIERLEEEKRALAEDIKEVYAEARGTGFDPKIMRQIIKLRRMDADARAEEEALLDIYKAALGMLADTPLGAAALGRLSRLDKTPPKAPEPDHDKPPEPPVQEPSPEEAREMGRGAASAGKPILANPFPTGRLRAAWDEGWCQQTGSDGMDTPEIWKRTPKPRKKPDAPGQGEHPPGP